MERIRRRVRCRKCSPVRLVIFCSLLALLLLMTNPYTDRLSPVKETYIASPVDVVLTQKQRQERMVERCRGRGVGNVTLPLTDNILVDERRRFLFCRVQKVANTNWKRFLGETSGLMTAKDILEFSKDFLRTDFNPSMFTQTDGYYKKIGIKPLKDYNISEIKYRIKHYFKFIFVRHPFTRLLSAYKDKFNLDNYSANGVRKKTVKMIVKKYRRGERAGEPERIRFDEFVRFVADTKHGEEGTLNPHWRPITDLCQPCGLRYDFIGHLETLTDDVKSLLPRIAPDALQKGITFPGMFNGPTANRYNDTTDRENVRKYFTNITAETREKLIRVYSVDFDLFGYDPRSLF